MVLTAAASPALADHDWVVNLEDTGFDPTPAGGTIQYQVAIDNNGPDNAPATSMVVSIPAGLTLTGGTGAFTGCVPVPAAGPTTATCPVPSLADATRASGNLLLRTTTQGIYTLGVEVTGTDSDPDNNSSTEATTVTAGADLSLNIAGPANASAGSAVTYNFAVGNNGPDAATNITLQVPIPTGLTDITPPPGCTLAGGTYSCTIAGPVAPGASVTLPFGARVSAAFNSTVTVVGSVEDGTPLDPLPANNTTSFNTAVSSGSDLTLTKTRSPSGTILVGNTVTFTLAPRYTGDSPSGITIVDTVPANYSITTVTPSTGSGWTCQVVGQTITCARESGSGPGANVSLGTIQIVTQAISAGTAANIATIDSAVPNDPIPENNTASDGGATIQAPTVDLRANKSGPNPPLVVVGNTYDFRVSATNIGNSPFYGTLVLTENLPAGLTATSYSAPAGWTCLPAAPVTGPNPIVCERVYTPGAPLAANATTPVVVISALATAEGTIANSVTVSSPNSNLPDQNGANDTATYSVGSSTGPFTADISVNKTAQLATVAAGDPQTFRIEIVNIGPQTATQVSMTDDLQQLINSNTGPTGAGVISFNSSANAASGLSCSTASTGGTSARLTCDIASLPICTPGVNCPTVEVSIRPGANGGARTNTASALSNQVADPNLSNNNASASFTVDPRADVTLTKVGSPSPATAGQNLAWVLTARNQSNGLSAAENVTITDALPAGLTFISATPSSGSCGTRPASGSTTAPGNNTVICNLGTVSNGSQQTLTILVRPNTSTFGTTLNNRADVTTSTVETNTANNSANSNIPVQPPRVDLLINKTDSVDPVTLGDNTVYTVVVTNNGPSAAENVTVTDNMPAAGLTYQSHTVPGDGSCSSVPAVNSTGGMLTCSFPLMVSGESRTITINARGTVKGVHTNNATVSSAEVAGGFDSNMSNNTVNQTTTVRTRVDLQVVSKTATPATVNLNDDFTYAVIVRNNTGAGLSEADGVVVNDTLPAGMRLVGTPTASVLNGTASLSSCTGAAGATSFACSFGTMSNGATVEINVPVEVFDVTARPQTLVNTATVSATDSYDTNPANNSNSGGVTVGSSSIAGRVYRDFNNNGIAEPTDTGLSGILMTLSGTSFDGYSVTLTATTNATGNYVFPFVPQGAYQITRGTVSETHLTPGRSIPGSLGGNAASATQIQSITMPAANIATAYDFTVIPTARIGLAKQVLPGQTTNPDGSFNVAFSLRVRNHSLEALNNVAVTDTLAGVTPLFGTYASTAAPLTDPLARGTYTMVAAPSGTCGGNNASFNGSAATTLASGITLASAVTCTIDFTIRVQPVVPLPTVAYRNSATVTGNGSMSGQTPATNPQLTDISDAGTNTDTNGNGISNEAGENDPTLVNRTHTSRVALVKTGEVSGTDPAQPGDTITYGFTVTNLGNVTLTNLTITDALPGIVLSGGPIASLPPGAIDSTTITGTYTLTQADLDAGQVTNTAIVRGTDPFDAIVTDTSGTTTTNDTPTVVPIPRDVSLAVVKTADASGVNDPTVVGDLVTYSFSVRNTGTVTLHDITVTDPKFGVALTGGPIATLAPGATNTGTFTATYAVTQADIDAGEVENRATAAGLGPQNQSVTDLSGDDFDNDNPTVVPLTYQSSIALVKTASLPGGEPVMAGDTIAFAFAVTNTGTSTLSNLSLTDALAGVTITGGPLASLAPGATDTATFTGAYIVTQADIDAGLVTNSATVTGTDPGGTPVQDVSGTDITNDTPTEVPITSSPSIALIKIGDISAISVPPLAGEPVTFRFSVTNTGNVTLTDITLADALPDVALSGGPITLAPGATDTATFTGTYALKQDDIEEGRVTNQATVTGTPPTGPDVTDVSGTDFTNDDPTEVPLDRQPDITLVKTADTSVLSSPPRPGEVITYHFAVGNPGNVILTNVTLTDILPNIVLSGGPISLNPGATDSTSFTATYTLTQADINAGEVVNQATTTGTAPGGTTVTDDSGTDVDNDTPTTVPLDRTAAIALVKTAGTSGLSTPPAAGDVITYGFAVTNTGNVTLTGVDLTDILPDIVLSGGPITLEPGETDSSNFTASYTLKQSDIEAGQVVNQATATGTPPTGPDVSDDSGTDITNDTPTEVPIDRLPAIELVKTADTSLLEDGAEVGDLVPYSFTVTNTGNVTLTNVVINDPLPGIALVGGPITLAPGETDTTTFTATYPLTAADISAGQVLNTAIATGTWTGGTTDDSSSVVAVVGTILAAPEVFPPFVTDGGTTTSMLASDTLNGAQATLSNVTLTVITTADGLTLDTGTGLITLAPGMPAGSYQVTYRICSVAIPTLCDEATETVVQLALAGIEAEKTSRLIDNGDGIQGVGDRIEYTIRVVNTGNVTLTDVTLTDTLKSYAGRQLTLDSGPTFVSADQGSGQGALLPGETATYTASYSPTVADVTDGGVSNSVLAEGTGVLPPGIPGEPPVVTDVSDNGIDTDGNTEDDPTNTPFDPAPATTGLTIEKTTTRTTVQRGMSVPYTITVSNGGPAVVQTDVVDVLPPGFLYVPGSATLNGTAIEVQVEGRVITWNSVAVPPQGQTVLTLSARIPTGVQPGDYTNHARPLSPSTGAQLAPDATAMVRILPEPVFDCGDVIGKVFDDTNRDGYQNQGEKGIPAVRLAGVDGTIITADKFGRFHVPCAMLPQDRGSNFILKLDTRSLPAGYRVTTENPRVIRLTPGKMSEMNFGAAITRVVRVDLNARAFAAGQDGKAALSPQLASGLQGLLKKMAGDPMNLRLAFHLPTNASAAETKQAKALMNLVERYIDKEWRKTGRVKLTIERTLVREN